MKHYAWFINKKRFFALIRFLDNSVGKVKVTLLSKKKVEYEELRSLLGYCNERKYCRNYLVNLRNITSLDNLRPFKDFSV